MPSSLDGRSRDDSVDICRRWPFCLAEGMAALRLFDDVLRIASLSKVLRLNQNYKSSKDCVFIIQRATCASTKVFGLGVSPGLSTRPSSDKISQHGDQIEVEVVVYYGVCRDRGNKRPAVPDVLTNGRSMCCFCWGIMMIEREEASSDCWGVLSKQDTVGNTRTKRLTGLGTIETRVMLAHTIRC